MLEYIENSGGRKYPFYEQGRVMRVASKEDLDEQARLEQSKHGMRTMVRGRIKAHGLDMRLVEVEPILGGERVMVYFSAEDRVDFRELVKDLQVDLKNRVELVQVGSRDEARIVADYERCGQYCCCKNFLKVLKPISMKSAKIQKATLDPLKISGRCGRLMCCLRYEDETYEQLRKNLPHRKSRVGTPEGDGIVIDSQILTQLSKIKLDDGTIVAIPIEELTEPKLAKAPEADERVMRREPRGDRRRGEAGSESNESSSDERKRKRRRRRTNDEDAEQASGFTSTRDSESEDAPAEDGVERPRKRRRRRSKKRTNRGSDEGSATTQSSSGDSGSDSPSASGSGSDSDGSSERSGPKKKRRRRRRRRGGSGDGGAGDGGSGGGDS
jgi:cell fate regulator YaaT (PSP1 superfamily)